MPADPDRLELDCYEAYNIQVAGLQQRLRAIGDPKVVIGVSGGLDSTHALIVAAQAMDRCGRPRSDILAFTLPGFATSGAHEGQRASSSCARSASPPRSSTSGRRPSSCSRRSATRSRPGEPVYDVTFENVQAGLRTDYLFRIANQRGGIVLGTGDLSELALGWATYGVGDQMSHYNVNGGVPKTLIQHLIRWVVSSHQFDDEVGDTLTAILDTEISPELVPGEELQSTESQIGPYALHDFTLFHVLRFGMRPSKIAFLAWHAWRDVAGGQLAARLPRGQAVGLRPARDPPLARALLPALLRLRPVQALGAAQRAEGLPRRVAVAARRLARPVGQLGRRVAARPRALGCRRLGGLTVSHRSGGRAPNARRRAARPG